MRYFLLVFVSVYVIRVELITVSDQALRYDFRRVRKIANSYH